MTTPKTILAACSQDIAVDFDLTDVYLNTITAAEWTVLDEDGNVVSGPNAVTLPLVESVLEVVVPVGQNQVTLPATTAAREVVLDLTTTIGYIRKVERYVLRSNFPLIVPQNSFVTLTGSLATAVDLPKLSGWLNPDLTDEQRTGALVEAYNRITRLGFFVRWSNDIDSMNTLRWLDRRSARISPDMWQIMTMDRFSTLYPDGFRVALRRAQVTEADAILFPSQTSERWNSGLTAETVGESKMVWRSGKPLDLGMTRAAIDCLTGYIDLKMTITRT